MHVPTVSQGSISGIWGPAGDPQILQNGRFWSKLTIFEGLKYGQKWPKSRILDISDPEMSDGGPWERLI